MIVGKDGENKKEKNKKKRKSTKYDRGQLKKEFFESKIEEVKRWFIEGKKMVYSSYIQKRTQGRTVEKKNIVTKANDKAIEDAKNELADEYKIEKTQLLKMKKSSINILQRMLEGLEGIEDNTALVSVVGALERMRQMTKTELLEPTTISQSHINDEIFEEEKEEISEKDKKAIEKLLEKL